MFPDHLGHLVILIIWSFFCFFYLLALENLITSDTLTLLFPYFIIHYYKSNNIVAGLPLTLVDI